MLDLRHWFVQNRDRVIDLLVKENGKTREDALLAELFYVCDALGFWAKKAPRSTWPTSRVKTHSPLLLGKKVFVRYRPHGVVGVIGPWNYPLTNSFGDCIPALMAGNSVVLKPSEITPLTTLMMAEAAARVRRCPRTSCRSPPAPATTGAALVDNVDMIHFTGSTATGQEGGGAAAERLIPVSLELGGKDPMIVLRDADVERAANMAVQWAMSNSGQICIAVERVYVEEPVYDEFVEKVVAEGASLRQGAPGEPGTVDVGAMTFPPQMEIIESHVQDAVDKGAQVLVGGKARRRPGAVLRADGADGRRPHDEDHDRGDVRPDAADHEGARRRRGGASSPTTAATASTRACSRKDVAKGEQVARRLTAGNACVNDALMNYLAQEAPFGGAGESGLGARHGAPGIRKYCSRRRSWSPASALKREPTMFPNTALKAKVFERLMVLMWGRPPKRRRLTPADARKQRRRTADRPNVCTRGPRPRLP